MCVIDMKVLCLLVSFFPLAFGLRSVAGFQHFSFGFSLAVVVLGVTYFLSIVYLSYSSSTNRLDRCSASSTVWVLFSLRSLCSSDSYHRELIRAVIFILSDTLTRDTITLNLLMK